MSRYVTHEGVVWTGDDLLNTTPSDEENQERFSIYRLCPDGERELVATCASPEAVGVALVTLGREGEWEGCAVGVLDTLGAKTEKWVLRPWLPSAKNVSDAGRTLATARHRDIK
jgi:hypothetical protein